MKRNKGIKYKLNIEYPKVRFKASTVSLPIKGVEYHIGYWVPNLTPEELPKVKNDYRLARQLILKNIDRSLFSEKFIYILECPEFIITEKSYIGWKFHFYTKGEVNRSDITKNLQEISHKLYTDVLENIEKV